VQLRIEAKSQLGHIEQHGSSPNERARTTHSPPNKSCTRSEITRLEQAAFSQDITSRNQNPLHLNPRHCNPSRSRRWSTRTQSRVGRVIGNTVARVAGTFTRVALSRPRVLLPLPLLLELPLSFISGSLNCNGNLDDGNKEGRDSKAGVKFARLLCKRKGPNLA
jgi:hypothetical protein